ncbi:MULTISPECIES: acyltransferase family protein [Marisediminitalea]|uniref:acyltransferase family protein n=1 Tax=Marisediminitalea TaxID=2662254 RepID=UPI0020CD0080|nr:acyltransferase family protein [Marisediminitalea aggregata]MCP3865263.1 acyltransferase family protein [Aestuariibacter sp.]MCP4527988.1 acyltransferase family protein [Aestuariibacter sp.]MCP9476570.1 acyltransferase family protein [Marisediminitalea aggregata]
MNTSPSSRLHYLDATRAFALLLGIVFHASLSFMPVFIGWAVMDVSTSYIAGGFALISHTFRMALFFLIAGFFSAMVLHKTRTRNFLQSRAVRLGVPFIVGWLVLRPLLVSGWIAGGQSMRGDADISASLSQGFASLTNLPNELFVGTHLWFLYYLILFTLSAIALRSCVLRSPRLHEATLVLGNKLVRFLTGAKSAPLLLAVPTACCLWWMNHWGIDTPDKSLVPLWPVFCLYFGCFLIGWAFQHNRERFQVYSRLSLSNSVFALISISVLIALTPYESQPGYECYLWVKALFCLAYGLTMWTLIPLTLGLCKKLFSSPKAWVGYLSDASYWLYLIHLPLVVALQIAVAELPLHWSVKLAAVCAGTVIIGLGLYEIGVRKTRLGRLLNGRKQPVLASAVNT